MEVKVIILILVMVVDFQLMEVIEKAKKITGKEIIAVEDERRSGDPPILVGSSDKIRNILKWKPKYSDLSQIIETAWKWHEKISK